MKKIILLFVVFVTTHQTISAQEKLELDRVEPSFWWVGFKNNQLQLIVHGTNIAQRIPSLIYAGVVLKSIEKVENPNYLFLNLQISQSAKPGKFTITFKSKGKKTLVLTMN